MKPFIILLFLLISNISIAGTKFRLYNNQIIDSNDVPSYLKSHRLPSLVPSSGNISILDVVIFNSRLYFVVLINEDNEVMISELNGAMNSALIPITSLTKVGTAKELAIVSTERGKKIARHMHKDAQYSEVLIDNNDYKVFPSNMLSILTDYKPSFQKPSKCINKTCILIGGSDSTFIAIDPESKDIKFFDKRDVIN